jgi:hypothetical protein
MPVAPKANLVAEGSKSTCPAAANGAFGNYPAALATQIEDRRLLDDERGALDLYLER